MKVFLMDQLTPEWWEVRRAVPTASEFDRIMTAEKRKYSAAAIKYIAALIAEAVVQTPNYFSTQGRPVTPAMAHGNACEPEARRYLEMQLKTKIEQVGFCMTDDMRFGCSPDGVIGLQRSAEPTGEWHGQPFFDATVEGVVELKCPTPEVQILTILTGECPTENPQQYHGHLIVTDAKYVEFLAYSEHADPFQKHIEPDGFTHDMRAALETFSEKYLAAVAALKRD